MNAKYLKRVPLLVSLLIAACLMTISALPTFASPPVQGQNLAAASRRPAALYDWLQFNFDPQHSGNNTLETTITPSNVNQLKKRGQLTLPAVADGTPVYLSAANTKLGKRNLLLVLTKDGRLIAIDTATGRQAQIKQYGPGTCKINGGSQPCYTTSSPVIDPNRLYVYAYGLDGYVHKYQVSNGAEIKTGGWPELATLKDFDEKGSSALSFATAQNGTTYLYVTNGGYPGDRGDYQGHVTAINLADGTQQVFNAMCSDQAVHFVEKPGQPDCPDVQSAIWARPGVIYDGATDKIYMATGNGTFAPGSHYWGDTAFELNPNGTGANGDPLDSYTPTDYQHLQNFDLDLGSTAPAILPVPPNSNVKNLALQSGKDSLLRLLNLDNLSGQGGPGHTGGEVGTVINVPQGGQVLTQPAVWVNPNDNSTWVFVADNNGISGLQLTLDGNNTPQLQPMWQKSSGGTSPIVANNVLFYVGSGNAWALDPTTGTTLWHDTGIGNIHWESPIVANGALYITDESSHLTAYTLNGK
jgi:hypothetical protein